jgi:hypothetical protein
MLVASVEMTNRIEACSHLSCYQLLTDCAIRFGMNDVGVAYTSNISFGVAFPGRQKTSDLQFVKR